MSKRWKKTAVVLLSAILTAVLCLSVLFLGRESSPLPAGAESDGETISWSNEEYYRQLQLNGLEANNRQSYASDQLRFSNRDNIVYTRQGCNTWGYLSIGLTAASTALFLLPGGSFIGQAAKLLTLGAKVGSNFALRESVLQKIGDANAEMLTDVMQEIDADFHQLSAQIDGQTQALQRSINAATQILYNQIQSTAYKSRLESFYNKDFLDRYGNPCGYYDWMDSLQNRFEYAHRNTDPQASRLLYEDLYTLGSYVNTLYNAIVGKQHIADDSILDTFYNYCLLAYGVQNFNMDETLYSCIEFGEELYCSYLFANTCLEFAYAYQAINMGQGTVYRFSNGQTIYSDDIQQYFTDLPDKIADVETELSRFYARVLNLDSVYTIHVKTGNATDGFTEKTGRISYYRLSQNNLAGSRRIVTGSGETDYYAVKHNHVPQGSTIYLASLPEILTMPMSGGFTFRSSDPTLATVSENGVVNVTGSAGEFSVSLLCGDESVYTFEFVIGNEAFSGGFGTEDLPYFISTMDDMHLLSTTRSYWGEEYHYLLTNSLTWEGRNDPPIGSQYGRIYGKTTQGEIIWDSPFAGTFDGNHNSISGKRGDPIFGSITGTVKNLNITGCSTTSYYRGSEVEIELFFTGIYGGILCHENRGTIDNCHIENCSLSVTGHDTFGTTVLNMFFGAIGYNLGTVVHCGATKVSIKTTYQHDSDNKVDPYCYQGALVGASDKGSVMRDCIATGSTVEIYFDNRIKTGFFSPDTPLALPSSFLGGVVGEMTNGTLVRCVSYGNTVTAKYEYPQYVKSENIGSVTGSGKTEKCYGNDMSYASEEQREAFRPYGWTFTETNRAKLDFTHSSEEYAVRSLDLTPPAQTLYHVGDTLNLAGLSVSGKNDSGETALEVRDYTVEAPDLSSYGTNKPVTVRWNGLSATFYIDVECPHTDCEETFVTLMTDCSFTLKQVKRVCNACGETVSLSTKTENVGQHTFGQGVVTKEPTYDDEGVMTFTCERCGATKTEQIPRLEHHVVSLSDGTVASGRTFVAEVTIAGNPDLTFASFRVGFDPDALELIAAEDTGLLLGGKFSATMGKTFYYLTWDHRSGLPNAENGVIARLTFRAKKAFTGQTQITIQQGEGLRDSQNQAYTEMEYASATIDIVAPTLGDIDGNGVVDHADLDYLKNHVARRTGYGEIDAASADVNGDGAVNMTDVAVLRRYLAGWPGVTLGGED